MKIELEWKHEICDTECYDEIFLGATGKYKDVHIFARVLPIKNDKYRFMADVMLCNKEKTLPLEKKVNTFKEGIEWAELAAARNIPEFLNEQHYVLGFVRVLDENDLKQKVLLIVKERPDFQKGKMNGIGGKIKAGETPVKAMIREFGEEVNSEILNEEKHWNNFYNFNFKNEESGQSEIVHCFRSVWNVPSEHIKEVLKNHPTDEKLVVVDYEDVVLGKLKTMPNIPLIVKVMYHYPMNQKDCPPLKALH